MEKEIQDEIQMVQNLVDYESDTEESLHRKIIMLYELIEKRTVENIQIKKKNDQIVIKTQTYKETMQMISDKLFDPQHNDDVLTRKNNIYLRQKIQKRHHQDNLHEATLTKQSSINKNLILSANISPRNSFLKLSQGKMRKNVQRFSSIQDLWVGTDKNDGKNGTFSKKEEDTNNKLRRLIS